MTKPITIIIPTFNNEEYLNPCVISIIKTGVLDTMADLIIVNNGKQDIQRHFGSNPAIKILNPGKNLGWEGGLQLGLENSTSPFLVFQNDDTHHLPGNAFFYQRLLTKFHDENVAAVGPVTTCAAGVQSIYHPGCPSVGTEVSYLIFFTVMVRRKHLEMVGGIDTTLPGGDDFDLSIRFRKAGFNLVVDPGAFIIHHGFKTGTRVHGDYTTNGGWNSVQMSDRTNKHLIQKHGFKTWWKSLTGLKYPDLNSPQVDREGDLVRSFIKNEDMVVELGCGHLKTVPTAIGVDRIPKGEKIPHLQGAISVADIVADAGSPLPFEDNSIDVIIARHILEHLHMEIETLRNWKRVLKPGGKLVIAVPDQKVTNSIPLNPEHCRTYTQESLKDTIELLGFREVASAPSQNGVSFVGCYERLN